MLDRLIVELIKKNQHVFLKEGTVTQVNGDVCTVLTETREYRKCRINAVAANGDNYLKAVPAVGSPVVVGVMEGNNNALLLKISEVDSIAFKKEDTLLKVDHAGYVIERQGENLGVVNEAYLEEFGKLCDELAKVVVVTGVSPNVPAITAIKTTVLNGLKGRFNKIFNHGD
jgi:hypothetical protein